MKQISTRSAAMAAILLACSAATAGATTLHVTVTNNQGQGGFSVTPLYTAFHNGSFDAFNEGDAASAGVEEIAELGMPGTLRSERLAADPGSVGTAIGSPSGPPPIQPGESASALIDVNPTDNRFLTFLSMLLPSNDTFLGNDDPMAYEIFDVSGNFLGPRTIEVTGLHLWDAGTEVNDPSDGPAFVAGQDISVGTIENGVITRAQDLSAFAGLQLATGDVLGSAAQLDFFSNPQAFSLLTITVDRVAPIPLPASAPLLVAAVGLLGWRARRRKSA